MNVTITALTLPERADEHGAVGEAFRAYDAHANRANDDRFGPGLVVRSPEQRLVGLRSTSSEHTVTFVAYAEEHLVGSLRVFLPQRESTRTADSSLSVEPGLPDADVRALTELLVAHFEEYAMGQGRTILWAGSVAAASGPIMARTGFGGADPNHPEVAPLVVRGYELEQVYRVSVADLTALPDLDQRLDAARARSDGHEVIAWVGPTPTEHRPAMRALHEGMSRDAPIGELAFDPEVWDDARLSEFEQRQVEAGLTIRTVAARRVATGELVGFSTLFVGSGDVADQHDTFVAGGHRGHGLGMLLKLANLAELRRHHPGVPRVASWNAEENRPMLAVNEATGFVPVFHDAVWQRRLPA